MSRIKTIIVVAALGTGSAALGFAATAGAQNDNDTRGPIPETAFESGQLDLSQVPDLVDVLGPEGTSVGYVRRDDLYPTSPEGDILEREPSIPVFDGNDRRVGDWVENRGFVAAGTTSSAGSRTPTTTVEGE